MQFILLQLSQQTDQTEVVSSIHFRSGDLQQRADGTSANISELTPVDTNEREKAAARLDSFGRDGDEDGCGLTQRHNTG